MPKTVKKKNAGGSDPVLLRREAGIAYLTLNRPEALNALNREMLEGLGHLLDTLKRDSRTRAVIITGAGPKAFSAGADIGFFSTATPAEVRERALLALATYAQIEDLGKPVVAAINGYALGGGLELAEACMLRVAADSAMVGHPEVRIGAVAGWGGTSRLPRLVGKGRAAELLLTGRMISAEEALRFGLVNRVVAPGQLMAETEGFVREILEQSPVAVRMTWEAMHRGCDLSLAESLALGADYFGLIAGTDDFNEGTSSFVARKKPSFKGR